MQDIIPPVAQGAPSRAVRRNRSGSRTSSFLVVGIGASAGGLEACRALLDAIPKLPNMAFIIVQHLEPSHPSMLVQLLANHTTMTIAEAADRTLIEPNHVYVIPPGRYLAVANGALKLSAENRLQGARLPFDRLLRSLATNYGTRAAAIIMSGHEHDGSAGLRVIKEHGGLVLVQSLEEAQFDGMPSSAIATGLVDQVLNVSGMPAALAAFAADGAPDHFGANRSGLLEEGTASEGGDETLIKIITLLRAETPHDFRLYKPGTLRRRIEQRIGTTNGEVRSIADYLEKLTHDPKECELLAKDLLINVTGFFRDPKVFEFLAKTTIPDLVRLQPDDQPIRVWIAGCSSGEETYSLAILFREAIAASKRTIKLQVFASDVDPDAIATARDGLYDVSIASEMTQARLTRFFRKEDDGYRVLPDLRADVVFAVQDLLIDPPFSRIDFISCRNVLIYLDAQAKTKVIALFHFALRPNGLLLLGSAETIADTAGRFEIVSKPTRLYKHIGRSRPGELSMLINDRSAGRPLIPGVSLLPPRSRHMTLGDLCRQTIADSYGPASILINAKGECLFFLGPTAPYLLVPAGAPTADLYALAIPPIKALLRSTVQLAMREQKRVSGAGRMGQNGKIAGQAVRIDVIPITLEIETLYLVCLIDQPVAAPLPQRLAGPTDQAGVAELERELETTRAELRSALINLEIVGDEQKAINEEALSINEEFQTTNEELQTSKEELQSLNEELSALNGQLQETLERYRSTANDLQNVLYSTEVATLFLDLDLKIRFFTPVTRTLFNVINSDIGRPLADLTSLASDAALADDTMIVLRSHESIEREVSAREGHVFLRRIMPYKTDANVVEGVVITFFDITERKRLGTVLEASKHAAEAANLAKTRFLAAASHDLRQPLQTLSLLQGLLAKSISDPKALQLVARFGATIGAMAGMLNALLDVNQIEAGTVQPKIGVHPLNDLLIRMRNEFAEQAKSQGISLRVVPTTLVAMTDPRLLEQIVRNLLSNAFKYTVRGTILVGCRRRGDHAVLEVWDSGIGIPETELKAIFEEYHQLGNPARTSAGGLGLGLAIVNHLSHLLGHDIRVRSWLGKGSVFSVSMQRAGAAEKPTPVRLKAKAESALSTAPLRVGTILVVEDEPEVRDLLVMLLEQAGFRAFAVADGPAAVDLVARGPVAFDLALVDYNLPKAMNGVEVATAIRSMLQREIDVIILTGDISTETLQAIAKYNCTRFNKPIKPSELIDTIHQMLLAAPKVPHRQKPVVKASPVTPMQSGPRVVIVDDDPAIGRALSELLVANGREVETYLSAEEFLERGKTDVEGCILVDAYLPGLSGLDLLSRLKALDSPLSAIMITGDSDVGTAVNAMKAGAIDFIEKPIAPDALLACIDAALTRSHTSSGSQASRAAAADMIRTLTPRQVQIMDLVLAGHPSKNIAADLKLSQRTVENHRATIMKKMGAKSLPGLARAVFPGGG